MHTDKILQEIKDSTQIKKFIFLCILTILISAIAFFFNVYFLSGMYVSYIVLISTVIIFSVILYVFSRKIKALGNLKKTLDTFNDQKDLIEFYDKTTKQFIVIVSKKLHIQNCNHIFTELLNKKKKSVLKKSIIIEIYKIIYDNNGELRYLITNSIEAAFQGIYGNIDLPLKNKLNKITPYSIMLYPISSETILITGEALKPNILVYSSLKNEKYSFSLNNKTEFLNLFADKLVSALYEKISLSDIALMKYALNILICEFFDNLSAKKSSKKYLKIDYIYESNKVTYSITAMARNFNWNFKLNESMEFFKDAVFSLTFSLMLKSFNKVLISKNGKKLTLVKFV